MRERTRGLGVIEPLTTVVIVTFFCMISPGPDMLLVARNSVVYGRHGGAYTSLGILTGNVVHISYCALGLGWLIANSIVAFNLLKYAGAAYLIYLGVQSLRARGKQMNLKALTSTAEKTPSGRAPYLQGLFNNLLNPKGALFNLGVFSVVLSPEDPPLLIVLASLCMLMVAASFWVFFVVTLGHPMTRGFLERQQQRINRCFGAFLILLGIRLAGAER